MLTVKTGAAGLVLALGLVAAPAAQTSLDALMERALANRDQSWRTLGQYILDERETLQLRAPDGATLFGFTHTYTWFERDGFFVRSPLDANGARIGEDERRRYEERWLESERKRAAEAEKKAREKADATRVEVPEGADAAGGPVPRFMSAAYFLDFPFEPGNYYLVGRDTHRGTPVYKIEYFPRRMFSDDDDDRKRARDDDDKRDSQFEQKLNKVARITLWVDPERAQILRYVFENVDFDFVPGRWLLRVDDVTAEMTMGQPFEGVWLPDEVGMRFAATIATGTYQASYTLDFHDYRLGDVTSRIRFDRRVP